MFPDGILKGERKRFGKQLTPLASRLRSLVGMVRGDMRTESDVTKAFGMGTIGWLS